MQEHPTVGLCFPSKRGHYLSLSLTRAIESTQEGDHRGRDLSDEATRQGKPRVDNHQKLERIDREHTGSTALPIPSIQM